MKVKLQLFAATVLILGCTFAYCAGLAKPGVSSANMLGRVSFNNGQTFFQNPFEIGSDQYEAWHQGWTKEYKAKLVKAGYEVDTLGIKE